MDRLTEWTGERWIAKQERINGKYLTDKDLFQKLAEYEDLGIEPEKLREFLENFGVSIIMKNTKLMNELREYKNLEEQGRLIKLPSIPKNKTIYWIWDGEIMPVLFKGIANGIVSKGRFHVVCRMATKKDKTFKRKNHTHTFKKGDERYFYVEDIGKDIFLTKEEAEKVIKGDL